MNKIICANPSILNRKNNVHINSSIKRVLDSGIYLNGVETKELESEFASYIGCNFAVGIFRNDCSRSNNKIATT